MQGELIAGRYRLEEPLGVGAMAAVWRAHDSELERTVAVKILGRDADRARFEREGRAAASLAHPNICQLYDYGESERGPYMVLEYLPGGTLEDRLVPGRPLEDAETERIATELASGLAHAHVRGLVHRDLKPANVLFDGEGRAKIADFGIARMGGAGTLTEAGTVLGTAAYISPEQATGEQAGPASDVYSFGVILFRMLAGRLPFESDSAMGLVAMHRDRPAPPVSAFRRDAPEQLEGLAVACLAKDPADRPADGSALLEELEGAPTAGGLETQVLPAAAIARRVSAGRRRRGLPLVLAAVGLLLAAGAALAVIATQSSDTSAPAVATTGRTSLTLPTVSTIKATTARTTTAATSTPATTTQAATSAPTTTRRPATTTLAPPPPATTIAPPPATTIAPPPATTLTPPPATTAPPATTVPVP